MTYPVLSIKSHKSQSMVEFALVVPILLLLMVGLLEVGRLIFIYSTVVTASREAVRYGSATGPIVTGGTLLHYQDCTGIRAAAQKVDFLGVIEDADIVISYYRDATNDLIFNPTVVSSNCPPPPAVEIKDGDRITISVSSNFSTIVQLIPLRPVKLTSSSSRTILISIIKP